MNLRLLLIALIVIAGAVIYLGFLSPDLELIDVIPASLEIEELDSKNILFQIKSNSDNLFENIKVIPNVDNDSGKYLDIEEYVYLKPIQGVGATSDEKLSIKTYARNSEGFELKYNVNLELFANDDEIVIQTKPVTITITPNPFFNPTRNEIDYPKTIQFLDFEPKSIDIKEFDDPKTVTFRITNTQNTNFNNIEIRPEIENHSGAFLEIKSLQLEKPLTGKGETTGTQSIEIYFKGSEGLSLKYNVYFDLYANGIIEDSEKIVVTVEP